MGSVVDATQADVKWVVEHPEAGPDEPEPMGLNLRRDGERE